MKHTKKSVKKIIQSLNIQTWNNTQDELKAARRLFNNAIDKETIDLSIKLEDAAIQKLEALRILTFYNREIRQETDIVKKKIKQNLADKIRSFIIQTFPNTYLEKIRAVRKEG